MAFKILKALCGIGEIHRETGEATAGSGKVVQEFDRRENGGQFYKFTA